jgi:pyridoxal phosphate enzyme (YggS family)
MSEITANIAAVQQRIEAAARRAGRNPAEITLVAVTKTQPLETVVAAYQAGLRHFGENRSEEYLDKSVAFARWLAANPNNEPAWWHFIGHLQSRQVGPVLEAKPKLIHSVDSLKLAQRINRLAERAAEPPLDILLQCNVSGEATKSGFALENWSGDKRQLAALVEAVEQMRTLDYIAIRGLMAMAPVTDEPETVRPVFQSLAAVRTELRTRLPQVDWQHLSMGMTDDFEIAVEEGATLIRVGRAIFGERDYQ